MHDWDAYGRHADYVHKPSTNRELTHANICSVQTRCLSLNTACGRRAQRSVTTCASPAEAAASAGLAKVPPAIRKQTLLPRLLACAHQQSSGDGLRHHTAAGSTGAI